MVNLDSDARKAASEPRQRLSFIAKCLHYSELEDIREGLKLSSVGNDSSFEDAQFGFRSASKIISEVDINIPAVANLLIERMLLAEDYYERMAAKVFLSRSTYPRAKQALELLDVFSSNNLSYHDLKDKVEPFLSDPVFVSAIISHVKRSSLSNSSYLAFALRKTPLEEKQLELKELLQSIFEDGTNELERANSSRLLLALSPDMSETKNFLLDIFTNYDFSKKWERELAINLVKTLGVLGTDVSNQLLSKFNSPSIFWGTPDLQEALAMALRANSSPSSESVLRGMIDGSLFKTARILYRQQHRLLGRALFASYTFPSSLLSDYGRRQLHSKRVFAAIALIDEVPDLAKKIFLDVTYGGSKSKFKCTREVGESALRALSSLE